VLGETDAELRDVFTAAGAAEVWEREHEFGCDENRLAVGGRALDLRVPSGVYEELFVPVHGAHQGDNAACAVAASEAFFGGPLGDEVVREALGAVTLPGRFEVVGRDPLVVLDGAHNAAGAAAVSQTLADDFDVAGSRILVVGVLAPRDPTDILEALDAASAHLVVACAPDSPRAVPASTVASAAAALGVPAEVVPGVGRAVDRALEHATEDDAVLVTGSIYVAGEARSHLGRGS
jgi:dihydrofolate synthase/folylpolyglutamate synthase